MTNTKNFHWPWNAITGMTAITAMTAITGMLGIALLGGTAMAEPTAVSNPPRLILQITVDQLRADLPRRYYDRLGEGGFRYLMEKGTNYLDAHHRHARIEQL